MMMMTMTIKMTMLMMIMMMMMLVITGRNKRQNEVVCFPEVTHKQNSEGLYDLTYVLTTPGRYTLEVRLHGQHIPGSPFTVVCAPPRSRRPQQTPTKRPASSPPGGRARFRPSLASGAPGRPKPPPTPRSPALPSQPVIVRLKQNSSDNEVISTYIYRKKLHTVYPILYKTTLENSKN